MLDHPFCFYLRFCSQRLSLSRYFFILSFTSTLPLSEEVTRVSRNNLTLDLLDSPFVLILHFQAHHGRKVRLPCSCLRCITTPFVGTVHTLCLCTGRLTSCHLLLSRPGPSSSVSWSLRDHIRRHKQEIHSNLKLSLETFKYSCSIGLKVLILLCTSNILQTFHIFLYFFYCHCEFLSLS